jgi:hypothetical protein
MEKTYKYTKSNKYVYNLNINSRPRKNNMSKQKKQPEHISKRHKEKLYNPILWIPLLFILAVIICYNYYFTSQGELIGKQLKQTNGLPISGQMPQQHT